KLIGQTTSTSSKRYRACFATVSPSSVDLSNSVWAFIRDGHAESTSKQYDSIETFYKETVCNVIVPFPASGFSLALFAYAMTRGDYKYSTVSSYVSAIISRNKLYGFGLSPHDDFLVNMAKRSASKLCDHTVEKKLPLSRQQVQQLGFLDPAGSNTIVSASLTGIFGLL
ncbi:hypothetical protein FOL47_003509, partial [Perkinsus chesapeaki]